MNYREQLSVDVCDKTKPCDQAGLIADSALRCLEIPSKRACDYWIENNHNAAKRVAEFWSYCEILNLFSNFSDWR